MDESLQVALQRGLTPVMQRFHDSFVGEGVNLAEDKVRFREREDFGAPLVTVLGHTYGLRLVVSSDPSSEGGSLVEASVNVYDDEFDLRRFKKDLSATYAWSVVSRIIANFATPEDESAMGGDPEQLAVLFRFDPEDGIEIVEKSKETASDVTGRLVDRVLRVPYGLDESRLDRADQQLFVSGVYLYCLRPFAAAYRKSLATPPGG